jgi:hypothetical protein
VNDNDLRNLWQGQPAEERAMSTEELRRRIEAIHQTSRSRDRSILLIFILGLIGFTWWLTLVDGILPKAGAVLTIVAVGYFVHQVRSNLMAEELATRWAAERGGVSSVEFHRAQLERQRDFHSGWQFWSRFVVILPGPLMFITGLTLENPHILPIVVLEVVAFLGLGVVAIVINRRAARIYAQRIAALEAMRG